MKLVKWVVKTVWNQLILVDTRLNFENELSNFFYTVFYFYVLNKWLPWFIFNLKSVQVSKFWYLSRVKMPKHFKNQMFHVNSQEIRFSKIYSCKILSRFFVPLLTHNYQLNKWLFLEINRIFNQYFESFEHRRRQEWCGSRSSILSLRMWSWDISRSFLFWF